MPMRKFALVAEQLRTRSDTRILPPEPVSKNDLLRVHTPQYVRAVETGEPRQLAESQKFPWSPELFPSVLLTNGGVLAAATKLSRKASPVLWPAAFIMPSQTTERDFAPLTDSWSPWNRFEPPGSSNPERFSIWICTMGTERPRWSPRVPGSRRYRFTATTTRTIFLIATCASAATTMVIIISRCRSPSGNDGATLGAFLTNISPGYRGSRPTFYSFKRGPTRSATIPTRPSIWITRIFSSATGKSLPSREPMDFR